MTEKHGGSSLFDLQNVAKFSPHGLFPAMFGKRLNDLMSRGLLLTLVSSMSPVVDWCTITGCIRTHSHTRHSGMVSSLLSCVCRAMAIAWLTHLRISIPASGAPTGQVPADCFPGGAPRQNRSGALRVTFAHDVFEPAVESPTVFSLVLEEPAPLVSPIVVEDVVYPEGELYGLSDVVSYAIPPPPGFPPFSWPNADEYVVIERFGSSLHGGSLPEVLVSSPDVEPPSSPIAQEPDSVSVDSPDDVVLLSPMVDVSTDSVLDVIRPVAPSPPMDQPFAPDRLWASVAVPSPAIDNRREIPVPRWWLAREGPFLAERSPESIRSLGLVARFEKRRTVIRTMTRLRGSSDCRCIIRGSLSGSEFRSPPVFWRWTPVAGWII